ncbi:uncharacterized protein LOC8076785 isoform X4 [Sorghum bicolor]|uniref:uncharacterized protein LOC8076785 isoform X4 n=1 Tax=Sorghum bicolor TaxID=4558 RepID=UPI00081AD24F|nr:uncharacterized protein LOC8076785 isoform X4 [Sorghum bicolor]|eukprot:XP_021317300.1 uncharacterized protein LOC8076785 isoform X4 [Sorghum bicolor]
MRPPKFVQGRLKSFTLHTTQEDFNIDISDVTGVSQTLPAQPVHQQPPHCPGPSSRPRSEEDDDDDDFMQPPTRHPVMNNNQRRTTKVVVNARRDGKVQKKNASRIDPPTKPKQQKLTKYLHAPTVRCAPSIFNSFIDLLTMSQRTRINNMNFGGLLQIRADKLVSREMLRYLYDRLDPVTMMLVLGKDRVIHINPFVVKQTFGIPDSGEELSLHTNQEACKALSDFKDFIGLQEAEDVHTKYLQEIWEADIELDSRMLDDNMCIKIFFMIASNKLLFPSSDNNIRAKDVYLARNLSRLPTMNWCKAVTDEIQEAARTWRLDRTTKVSPSITGCAFFLLIVYLDNLRCKHQINHKDIPRAKYFNQDLIKKIIAADKTKDDQGKVTFGRLPLRDISDTVYHMPHHSILEKPANIQPVSAIQFPSILSELVGVVNVTVAKPKRKPLVQAFTEFDIKSKKATTYLNRGQLMLQTSHDQLIAKVRSILENQSCENNSIDHQAKPTAPTAADANDLDMHDIHNGDNIQSEHVTEAPNHSKGYGTNQHINHERHVPLQQNSPTEAAAPQPMDAATNAGSEQELDHEHSPVHTDVTIGDVVPPILGQAMDQEGTGQASHIGRTSSLDSLVDLITASVIRTAHRQTTTTDTMTPEPVVLTHTQHQLPNEVIQPDSTIGVEPLLPAAHPQTTTTDTMTSEPAMLTHTQHPLPNEVLRPDITIDDEPLLPVYPKPQRLTRRPSKYVSPFKGDPMRTRVPMSKALAVRKKFRPSLKSLNEVFISTGFIDFTGNEILDSFPNDQELSTKFMSYFVQCLSHDESVHMPDGGGYRVFLPHRIGEYVNMEDQEEYEEWEFHNALEILESGIASIDTTNVKLFFLPIMEEDHYTVYCINLIHDRIDILDSSPDDHRLYHEVVGNRIIPRLNLLFQEATDGKLKSFTRFRRPILPVPVQRNATDSGFYAIKFMELWNGESFHLPILTENAAMYRDQLLYYAIYHEINTVEKLPAGLEALKPRR